MALCPSTVASSGKPQELYFALKDDIPAAQTLSQNGNTISLSGGGGSVNVAAATAVALSTQKLTATTYDAIQNKTSTAGQVIVFEPALEVRIEPKLEVNNQLVVQAPGGIYNRIDSLSGIYTTGPLQVRSEIKDDTDSAGLTDQVLTSNGPGAPWSWKSLGSGGGTITSVGAGSNISVTGTASDPVVNVAISSDLNMNGRNIIAPDNNLSITTNNQMTLFADSNLTLHTNDTLRAQTEYITATVASDTTMTSGGFTRITGGTELSLASTSGNINFTAPSGTSLFNTDVDIKGAAPSINFQDITGTQRASVDYNPTGDKLTAFAKNVVLDTNGVGYPRVLLNDGVGVTVRADDLPVTLQRWDAAGENVASALTMNADGSVSIGDATTTGGLSLVDAGDEFGSIGKSGGILNINGTLKTSLSVNGFPQLRLNGGGTMLAGGNGGNALLYLLNDGDSKVGSLSMASDGTVALGAASGDTNITAPSGQAVNLQVNGTTVLNTSGDGNVAIGGNGFNGSVILNTGVGSATGGISIDSGGTVRLTAAGGDVVADQSFVPSAGIKDSTGSVGSAGQFLGKDGGNQLAWTTAVPGAWSGTAASDLDMNGYKITDNLGNLKLEASGGNNVVINSGGSLAKLIQTSTETQIAGDTTYAYPPTLRFTDAATSVTIALDADVQGSKLAATNVNQFQVWTGLVEGVQMGVNTSVGYENFFRGMGLPLRIAPDATSESATYMLMNQTGDVSLYSGSGGHLAIGTGNTIDGHGAEIVADDGIRLDAVGGTVAVNAGSDINLTSTTGNIALNATPNGDITMDSNTFHATAAGSAIVESTVTNVVLTAAQSLNTTVGQDLIFNGANIDSLTAGPNTTHHLRIKLNGVYYKIQLKAD